MVVILPLTCSHLLHPKFSDLKQVILDQVRQNGYQTVPFSVYTHNLMCFICFWSVLHDRKLFIGACVFRVSCNIEFSHSSLTQTSLDSQFKMKIGIFLKTNLIG